MNVYKKISKIIVLILFVFSTITLSAQDIVVYKNSYNNAVLNNKYSDQTYYANKLGFEYWNTGKTDSAIYYFKISIDLNEKYTSNVNGINSIKNYLGILYSDKRNLDSSFYYYNSALEYYTRIGNRSRIAGIYINIANLYQSFEKYEKSNEYSLLGLQHGISTGDRKIMRSFYSLLYKNYYELGNQTKMQEYFVLYQSIDNYIKNEEINKIEEEKEITQKQLQITSLKNQVISDSLKVEQYRTKEQDVQIRLLEQDKIILEQEKALKESEIKRKEVEIEKKNIVMNFLLTVILLVVLFFIILYYQYRQKVKMNKQLAQLNSTKDKFFSIISHDLKNPIRSLKAFSDKLVKRHDKLTNEKKLNYVTIIHESTQILHELLESLLEWSRSQRGKITFEPKANTINKVVSRNIKLMKANADEKSIILEADNNGYSAKYDDNMIDTVIRNLISNAIKFTPEGGKVSVHTKEDNKYITISVKDTGVGMNKKDIDKLFQIDKSFTSKGTEGEKGTGLGLILCHEFVKRHQGKIWVESEEGKGSTFSFTINKSLS